MKVIASAASMFVCLGLFVSLNADTYRAANTYGSVEPIANDAVIDTGPFATSLCECGKRLRRGSCSVEIVSRTVEALTSTGSISTINDLNTHVAVGAGGFAGNTNPSYVYTVIDDGPNAASIGDVKVLTDSLGYVLSQGSAFLLDADNTSSFDFPANYVVVNFRTPPPISVSAGFFRLVGRIDNELFATDTSGYTQYQAARISHCNPTSPTPSSLRATRERHRSLAWNTRHSSMVSPRSSRVARPFRATTGPRVPMERNIFHGFPPTATALWRASVPFTCV